MDVHGHTQSEVEARVNRSRERNNLRDFVYGAIDGSVTTFALVAGVAGAGLSSFVIVALGLANVLADGFSMAAGNYSGTKAELDDIRRLREVEKHHLKNHREGEILELREILRGKGLNGQVLEAATEAICKNEDAWIELMLEGEYGVGGADPHPLRAALATFGAFMVAGMVPLIPFLMGMDNAFRLSAISTLAVFFAIGALKARWSLVSWWRSGLETLTIGGVAAGMAYVVGTLFHP